MMSFPQPLLKPNCGQWKRSIQVTQIARVTIDQQIRITLYEAMNLVIVNIRLIYL